MRFTLVRKETSDEGTFGVFSGEGLTLHTAELPVRGNSPRISCIPSGRYICRPYSSAKFPNVYEVMGVPGRSAILIHSGNHAGDYMKGYRSDVLGCILVGLGVSELAGQLAVTSSRSAMDKLRAVAGLKTFELEIIDDMGRAG